MRDFSNFSADVIHWNLPAPQVRHEFILINILIIMSRFSLHILKERMRVLSSLLFGLLLYLLIHCLSQKLLRLFTFPSFFLVYFILESYLEIIQNCQIVGHYTNHIGRFSLTEGFLYK